ncbi:hypothetical protein MLD52_17345 [Puniceicoccaceae bacterium K14]|nr:hypothetical protein [Puniceicoccaceae bacterium K14]
MNEKSELAKMIGMTASSAHLSMDAAKSMNRIIFKETKRSVTEHIAEIDRCENNAEDKALKMFHKSSEESEYLD